VGAGLSTNKVRGRGETAPACADMAPSTVQNHFLLHQQWFSSRIPGMPSSKREMYLMISSRSAGMSFFLFIFPYMFLLTHVFIDTFICDMTHMNEFKMGMSNLPLGSILARYFERLMNILRICRSPFGNLALANFFSIHF